MGRFTWVAIIAALLAAGCSGARLQGASIAEGHDGPSGIVAANEAYAPALTAALLSGNDSDEDCSWPVPAPPLPNCPPLPPGVMARDEAPAPAEPTPPSAVATDVATEAPMAPADVAAAPQVTDTRTLSKDCCPKRKCESDCCWGNALCGGYVGGSAAFFPGLGVAGEFGWNFKMTKRAMHSYDFGFMFQDMTDEFFDGDGLAAGKISQIRVGIRTRFNPCCSRWHPTLRYGISWLHATGDVRELETANFSQDGDHFGFYFGAGIEYDINDRWSTGPEAAIFGGWDVSHGTFATVPTLYWHLNYKF